MNPTHCHLDPKQANNTIWLTTIYTKLQVNCREYMTLFCSGFILIIYMQVQWHQFFDFLFLDLNRKANCLNRNVKSYDNINSFPRISEKIFTYTLIKLAPDSPCDKLFTVHVPGCGG